MQDRTEVPQRVLAREPRHPSFAVADTLVIPVWLWVSLRTFAEPIARVMMRPLALRIPVAAQSEPEHWARTHGRTSDVFAHGTARRARACAASTSFAEVSRRAWAARTRSTGQG